MVATITISIGGKVFKGMLAEQKPGRSKQGQKKDNLQIQARNTRLAKIKIK